MTQEEFFTDVIGAWEGALSLDPDDRGNWFATPGGAPVLVGSKHGVTGATLARFRGCASVCAADVAALTLAEAARIGTSLFYRAPGFARLPWDPLVASAVDFGWGAGPRQAVRLLQALLGTARDGRLGDGTAAAYAGFVAREGLPAAARRWQASRERFYRALVLRRPVDARYLDGWLRRTGYFLPDTPWWRRFTETSAPHSSRLSR